MLATRTPLDTMRLVEDDLRRRARDERSDEVVVVGRAVVVRQQHHSVVRHDRAWAVVHDELWRYVEAGTELLLPGAEGREGPHHRQPLYGATGTQDRKSCKRHRRFAGTWHREVGTVGKIDEPMQVHQLERLELALEAGRTRYDIDLRKSKYQPFLDAWIADAPAIGLYQPRFLYVTQGPFENYSTGQFNSAVDRFYSIENWQIRREKTVR